MRRICAWCQVELAGSGGPSEPVISHGICPTCVALMEADFETVGMLLDRLGAPTVAVDGQGRLVTASRQAAELLDIQRSALVGLRGGQALKCSHAALPGGCGYQLPCQNCAIRKSVMHTHQTGESLTGVRARQVRLESDEAVPMEYVISTEQVGAVVLLRIDQAVVLQAREVA